MRIEVTAQLYGDDGVPMWGYSHVEGVPMTDDAQGNGLRAAALIDEHLGAARASIVEQAQAELPLVADQQDEAEGRRRRPQG